MRAPPAELRERLNVIDEPTEYLGRQPGGDVSDLVFRDLREGQVRYVGYIRYKLTDSGRGRSSDYYQLLAYTTAARIVDFAVDPGKTGPAANSHCKKVIRALSPS